MSRNERSRCPESAFTLRIPETCNRAMLLANRCCGFVAAVGFRIGERHGHTRLAHLEAGETAYGDILSQLADLRCDQLADADGLVLDEGLLEQADFLVELFHLAGHNLFRNVRRVPAGAGLCV